MGVLVERQLNPEITTLDPTKLTPDAFSRKRRELVGSNAYKYGECTEEKLENFLEPRTIHQNWEELAELAKQYLQLALGDYPEKRRQYCKEIGLEINDDAIAQAFMVNNFPWENEPLERPENEKSILEWFDLCDTKAEEIGFSFPEERSLVPRRCDIFSYQRGPLGFLETAVRNFFQVSRKEPVLKAWVDSIGNTEAQRLTYLADVHAERLGVFPDHTLGIPYHLSTITDMDERDLSIPLEDLKKIKNEPDLHKAIRGELNRVGRNLMEGAWFLGHYAQSLAHYSKCEYLVDMGADYKDFCERCRLFAEALGCRLGNDMTTAADLRALAPWGWPVEDPFLPYGNLGQNVENQSKVLRKYLSNHLRRPLCGDVDQGVRIEREDIDNLFESTVEFPARRYSSAYTKANEVYEEARRLVPHHEYGVSLLFQAKNWKHPAQPALNRGITMVDAVMDLIRLGVGNQNIDFGGFVSRLRHEMDDKSWDYFKPFLRSFWTYAVDNYPDLHLNDVRSEEAQEVVEAIAQGGAPQGDDQIETPSTSAGNADTAQESLPDEATEEETNEPGRIPKIFGCETMKECESAKLCKAFCGPVGANDKGAYFLQYRKGDNRAYIHTCEIESGGKVKVLDRGWKISDGASSLAMYYLLRRYDAYGKGHGNGEVDYNDKSLFPNGSPKGFPKDIAAFAKNFIENCKTDGGLDSSIRRLRSWKLEDVENPRLQK